MTPVSTHYENFEWSNYKCKQDQLQESYYYYYYYWKNQQDSFWNMSKSVWHFSFLKTHKYSFMRICHHLSVKFAKGW